jgi:hypothetical protein
MNARPDAIPRCRSCSAPVWWRRNPTGKYQPMDFDLLTNSRTSVPHHVTCPTVTIWRPLAKPGRQTDDGKPVELPFP